MQHHPGVIITDISDHFPVFCLSDCDLLISKTEKSREKREINEENIIHFANLIQMSQWSLDQYDVNTNYNDFIDKFINLYDICFPIKSICNKYKRRDKPWFSNEIRKMSNKKCRMYKMYIKNPT